MDFRLLLYRILMRKLRTYSETTIISTQTNTEEAFGEIAMLYIYYGAPYGLEVANLIQWVREQGEQDEPYIVLSA
jgi:hypothetical protein